MLTKGSKPSASAIPNKMVDLAAILTEDLERDFVLLGKLVQHTGKKLSADEFFYRLYAALHTFGVQNGVSIEHDTVYNASCNRLEVNIGVNGSSKNVTQHYSQEALQMVIKEPSEQEIIDNVIEFLKDDGEDDD